MFPADFVFLGALAITIGCTFYFKPRIKGNRMAMQWDATGKPTWFAPKWLAVWWGVALIALLRLIVWVGMVHFPTKTHQPELGIVIGSIVVAASHLYTLLKATKA
jgi:uncharacterized membrane protein